MMIVKFYIFTNLLYVLVAQCGTITRCLWRVCDKSFVGLQIYFIFLLLYIICDFCFELSVDALAVLRKYCWVYTVTLHHLINFIIILDYNLFIFWSLSLTEQSAWTVKSIPDIFLVYFYVDDFFTRLHCQLFD